MKWVCSWHVFNYKDEGVRGLLKDGGSKCRAFSVQAIESLGGTQEAFYFAFGEADAYIIADFPDHVSAAAVSLVANSPALSAQTGRPADTGKDRCHHAESR